ncbi:hypothetical protein ACJO2E_05620 [Marinobacter sp. M1N3S26]|uniref:hypothetical protein n=1 Tax=Marinobacter sp. M1N3S26 TaxID=3382299 RepID=UPI00387B3C1E
MQLRWQVAEAPAVYSVVNQEIDVIPELLISGFDVADDPDMRRRVTQDLRSIELPAATYEGRVEPHEGGVRASLLAVSPEGDRAPQSGKEELHRRMAEQKAGLTELLGDFSADGKLRSFFLGRRHQAALNLLFSLPSNPLGRGDSWSPDVTGIEIGERFFPKDSRRIHKAILESLGKDDDGRLVATMFYVITDEVSGHFEYKQAGDIQQLAMDVSNTYFAVGDFLVDQGRWKAFTAVNANVASGSSGSERMILYDMRLEE